MLNVQNVSKAFDTPRGPLPILDDVSMSLERGQSAAIMGPSGSGKSTLLYIIGALEPPSSGTVTLDGVNPWALPEAKQAAFRNERVGFVFQDHLLLPQLTALENVLTPAIVRPDGVTNEIRERARELLAQVGLAERAEHRPAELSGGERQRVALARALIGAPGLLLCDEPTGNLDRTSAASVADLLVDLHQKLNTILLVVTHSLALAERVGHRYELDSRRLVS
ncbi:MAG TPA: ABC transporter ATP-binding protein [Vicinamibacterales bacterium]|nr:ABC transporter ATP-binding protein [Vicinamibacterales bacterium]